ncbi:MAG: DUF5724 domain-containing protein [Gemmataceae bacterium]
MLQHEVAVKRLQKFQVRGWEKQKLAAIKELPAAPRALGFLLFGRDSSGKSFSDYQKRNRDEKQIRSQLDRLSARDRDRLFSTLFPQLARHIEGGWQLIQKLPYETDYTRKGFRAPHDSVAHREERLNWLSSLVSTLRGYDPDVTWCAAWAPYLAGGYDAQQFGLLFAAAIDAGGSEGDEVFRILRESATNEHETGGMGRHVPLGLLAASRPDGWEFIEKLLLAAQRQEGLRQVILEAIDLTHPQAFRRMVGLILEHNLLRFSSTVRAVDVWFGLQWSALTPAVLKRSLELVKRLLDEPAECQAVIDKDDGEPLYLALWSVGFDDVHKAIPLAQQLLKDPRVERRFIAARFLNDVQLPPAREALRQAIGDEDLRVAVTALEALTQESDETDKPDLWKEIVALLERMPTRSQMSEPLVWPWAMVNLNRSSVASELLDFRGKRPVTDLIPFIKDLASYQRGHLIDELARMKRWDAATRDLLFSLVGDRDSWVRGRALAALKKCNVTEEDAQRIEIALSRKGSEMRQGVLALLRKQALPQVIASADRLLTSKKEPQRRGGLELLQILVEKKKAVAECRQRALAYREHYPRFGEEEELLLEAILDVRREKPSLVNALGLIDPAARTPSVEPVARKVTLCTATTVAILKDLDRVVHEHRREAVVLHGGYYGDREMILEDIRWGFPGPDARKPAEADALARLPLYSVWKQWYEARSARLRDRDGFDLIRALALINYAPNLRALAKQFGKSWAGWMKLLTAGQTPPKLKHGDLVESILTWLMRLYPAEGATDFLLDVVETGYAHVPDETRRRVVDMDNWQKRQRDWRIHSPVDSWQGLVSEYTTLHPQALTLAHRQRLWSLFHWRDQPAPGVARVRPDLEYLVVGFQTGQANEVDVIDHLVGPGQDDFSDLRQLSDPGAAQLKSCPTLEPIVERIKARVLEIELKRGEMPTAATSPAKALEALPGAVTLFRLLEALGKRAFAREVWPEGRTETLTGLVRVTYPTPDDTPEQFAHEVRRLGLTTERLLQLAFVAPAWLDLIEATLNWPGLKEAVWWFLAHMPSGRPGIRMAGTNDEDDGDDIGDDIEDEDDDQPTRAEPMNAWEKLLAERTRWTPQERHAGAVDPAWFHRVFAALGRKRWDLLGEAAKWGCSGAAQKKAIRISEVLRGRAKKSELVADIRQRKLKESVRLLGLLPLPASERREAELLQRYQVLVEYRRYARSLGPMSREDSERTAQVGLENLALTAGYPDLIRLEWAMEAKQIADLAAGPVSVTAEGVTVTLSITEAAQPELQVRRGEKVLKSVPPAIRKQRKVAELLERRTDLKRQASRVKQTLETMMIRGDTFSGSELRQLASHPLLRPLLERLVILGEGIRGYPVASGQALEDHTGKREPVKHEERLRLAHPYDLFAAGDWDRWQAHCFQVERVQPFKQVFRELYTLTQQEKDDGALSHRYAGQQVNPNQATALWGSRGWRTGDGLSRTFHEAGIVAEVHFRHHGWTGAQVEGWTFEAIEFRKVGEYRPMPLADVPPRIFSEVMRDGDLVVSVAHVGGVDPEASASTVQMREALVRETCALLHIENFQVMKSHILIDGKLGKYSIHLGSGVVHRQPGGHVCIVPVHSQHRGRLFLPFADDDPRTAEVVSKVLLLTRDHEIQDPSILEQLRS